MRILICEDSVLLREGISRLLDDAGHDVVAQLPDATELESTILADDPEVVAQLLARRRREGAIERLTPRARQVLSLMAEGAVNQTIAPRLHVSEGSVEKHISAVFRGLGLEPEDGNRRVLAVLALLDAPNQTQAQARSASLTRGDTR